MPFREVIMSNLVYILLLQVCLFAILLFLNIRENRGTIERFIKKIRNRDNRVILIFLILLISFVFIMQMSYMCKFYSEHKVFTLAVA